jgi:cobalt-zinc-cadmium efflux system membrane fusion protein
VRTTDIADARNALAAALAQRTAAAAQVRVANDNAARAEEVYRTAGGALKDLQQARSDLVAAQSQVGIADAAVTAARAKLGVRRQWRFGRRCRAARADRRRGGHPRDCAGAICERRDGGRPTPSFLIADLSQVWLVAQVAESDASRVHLGDKVVVTATAYPGRTFDATIDNIAAQIDPVSHRLQVRATIPNPDGALKPQMFANFTIETPDKEVMAQASPRLLSLPVEAVIHEGDSARVWVWLGHGRSRRATWSPAKAMTGGSPFSGLNPGEKVVTEGAIFVNEAGLD